MTYEKAELILQQLMSGDRDYYLVQGMEGKPCITDRPKQQRIVGELLKKKKRLKNRLYKMVQRILGFLCPTPVEQKALYINTRRECGSDDVGISEDYHAVDA